MKILILAFMSVSSLFAQELSYEQIFSTHSAKGAILCSVFDADAEGKLMPVIIYEKPEFGGNEEQKRKLLTATIEPGACHVLYYAEENGFTKVLDENRTEVWISVEQKKKKSILALASSRSPGQIKFKDEDQKIYTDAKFAKTLKASEIFDNKPLPGYLFDLKIKIPFANKAKENSSIEFWRSTTPKAKSVVLKVPELYTYVTAEVGGSVDWDVKVVDKEGEKLLIAYVAKMSNSNIASTPRDIVEAPSFSWIKLRDMEIERTKKPEHATPLFLKNQVIYLGNEKIKDKEYSRFRVIQLIADPKRAENKKYPESIAVIQKELRQIWVPTYDARGGITFWLSDLN
jgi:hypothetical protein